MFNNLIIFRLFQELFGLKGSLALPLTIIHWKTTKNNKTKNSLKSYQIANLTEQGVCTEVKFRKI